MHKSLFYNKKGINHSINALWRVWKNELIVEPIYLFGKIHHCSQNKE